MNVSIVLFSPSGHTRKAALMFQEEFEKQKAAVNLLDMTKNEALFNTEELKNHLEEKLGDWDLLLVGGPLYAGHIESYVVKIIQALPGPQAGRKNLALPFVTYGGVHTSVALQEMGRFLKKKGYKNIMGIKLAAKHTLTQTLSRIIYPERPGPEEEAVIREGVHRCLALLLENPSKIKDRSRALKCPSLKKRIFFKKFTQEKLHRDFKKVSIIEDKCIQCRKCIKACPLNIFGLKDGRVAMIKSQSTCILCAECFHNCPAGAIDHPYIEMAKKRLKDGHAPLEMPPSAIIPAAP
ncbi:4Fe-4S ferredoxin [candidate division KSB3 bacterium]|uniref:4Fe-4S ferredoxin n=1 Tax=candidate division KSB3 bacterium TaxID=2044937 RepID=A0A2G6E0Z3_9BACT|nr:MAG: 4Fe-4S ferredoxin [candidate division KSB3 bacterium]